MFHLGVGRSQIEWKLKVKTQISVFPWAKIGQNDHSNPYIESTTVLSDYYRIESTTILSDLMKGTKVQTLSTRAVAGAWLVAWAILLWPWVQYNY